MRLGVAFCSGQPAHIVLARIAHAATDIGTVEGERLTAKKEEVYSTRVSRGRAVWLRRRVRGRVGSRRVGYGYDQGGLGDAAEFGWKSDVSFCEWMAREVGVAAVPGSSFFHEPVNNLIRLHFAKRSETLAAAGERLLTLRSKVGQAEQSFCNTPKSSTVIS